METIPNEEYQRLLRADRSEIVERLSGEHGTVSLRELVRSVPVDTLWHAIRDLGGHDYGLLLDTYRDIDPTRPTVLFAYTIKGRGLPTEGHPNNHSALLSEVQMKELAESTGSSFDDPWQTFSSDSPEGRLCAERAQALQRSPVVHRKPTLLPTSLGRKHKAPISTQAALGRLLADIARDAPAVAARLVTCSPDVASSTNLGGWINKTGVWSVADRHDWFADDSERVLRWAEATTGRHVELGIAEVNLVSLLRELGAIWSRWGESHPAGHHLRPVRGAGARALVVRDVRRRPVDPGRHAVRCHVGAGRRGTSPSPHRPSAWNNRAASRGSRRSRRTWSGACCTR